MEKTISECIAMKSVKKAAYVDVTVDSKTAGTDYLALMQHMRHTSLMWLSRWVITLVTYASTHRQTGPFLLVSLFTGVDLSCSLPLTGAPYLFNTVWVG